MGKCRQKPGLDCSANRKILRVASYLGVRQSPTFWELAEMDPFNITVKINNIFQRMPAYEYHDEYVNQQRLIVSIARYLPVDERPPEGIPYRP